MKKFLRFLFFILIFSDFFYLKIFAQGNSKFSDLSFASSNSASSSSESSATSNFAIQSSANSESSNSEKKQNIYKIENSNDYLYIMTLENGLTLFVREDYSSALIHTRFSCKAGFSKQNKFNAGFFPLFTKLFASKILSSDKIQNKISLEQECNADSSNFTSDISPFFLSDYLKTLSEVLQNPSFSDQNLNQEFSLMKEQVKNYASSTAGFINSAIDSKIFYQEPWKVDSGIYPSLFSSYSPQEARTILSGIAKKYYVPENSSIFISGNISHQNAYEICKNAFSDWKKVSTFDNLSFADFITSDNFDDSILSETNSNLSTKNLQNKSQNLQKKYVLVSQDFSSEITQIVIQYKSLSMAQADILSSAWNNFDSPLKARILNEGIIGLRSTDYINVSSAQKSESSRLIIQSLLEKPYSFLPRSQTLIDENGNFIQEENPPVVEQVESFLEQIKKSSLLSRKQFIAAQNEIYSNYKVQNGNAVENINMLSDFWALNPLENQQEFYTKYLELAHKIQSENEKSLQEKILNEEPYIFVLVNDKIFREQENHFLEKSYELITKENASWYQNEMNLLQEKSKLKFQKSLFAQNQNQQIEVKNFAQSFYDNNISSIKTFNLKNGIPVTLKENPESQNACISICIYGGELSSPKNESNLRTVLINLFARNIQNELTNLKRINIFEGKTSVKAWTQETCSYITINCLKNDIPLVLEASFNAIIYTDFPPILVDNLVSEQKFQWKTKNSFLTEQLKSNALSYLYRGTETQKLFNNENEILKKTNYNSVSLSYTQLLNANLYSFVIVGDIKLSEAENIFKNNFDLLLKQSEIQEYKIPEPQFKNKTRNVQLQHIFTTNLSAEIAPKESPILVPTKDFFDPCQFYFPVPQDLYEQEIFNALLYEFEFLIQNDLGEKNKVSAFPSSNFLHVGILQAEEIYSTSVFVNSYDKARNFILEKLKLAQANFDSEINSSGKTSSASKINSNGGKNFADDEILQDIKSLWVYKNFSQSFTNEGTAALIQKSLTYKNPVQYLENYVFIENLNAKDFLKIFEKYFPEDIPFKVFSVDSKR